MMLSMDFTYEMSQGLSSCQSSVKESDLHGCISAMCVQEAYYLCHDYLGHDQDVNDMHHDIFSEAQHHNNDFLPRMNSRSSAIDQTCRSKMCEWFYQVVDHTQLQRDTVSVAMNYLDRYMCSSSHRAQRARSDRKEYQLAALTSLYIAVKIFEPLAMDAALVSKLSRGLHTAEEITDLELHMLTALSWRVNGPSPVQFVNHILELLPDSAKDVAPTLYDLCHFQTELAVGDYAFVTVRRSTIAVAALLNAMEGIQREEFPFEERAKFILGICNAVDFDIFSPEINAVRMRLLESYFSSSGYELSQVAGLTPIVSSKKDASTMESFSSQSNMTLDTSKGLGCEASPVCVSREMTQFLNMWFDST